MEDWRPVVIEGFMLPNGEPRYEVSLSGKVRWVGDEWSEQYGWLLRQHMMWGEPCVWLNKEKGVGRIWRVSELVKLAFGPEASKRGRKSGVAKKTAPKKEKISSTAVKFAGVRPEVSSTVKRQEPVKRVEPVIKRQEQVPVVSKSAVKALEPTVRHEEPVAKSVEPIAKPFIKQSEPAVQTKVPNTRVPVADIKAESDDGGKSSSSRKVEKTAKAPPAPVEQESKPIVSVEELLERARNKPKKDGRSARAKGVKQWTKDGKLVAEYSSLKEASAKTGVSYTAISTCCHGRCKSAGGYSWSLA